MKFIKKIKNKIHTYLIFRFGILGRIPVSRQYIKGNGIEIGAMDLPLKVGKNVNVKYLDRIHREEQVKIFPDLVLKKLVKVDIIGNGETLENIENNSQDFIIANHFIEHCQNPILTIENFLRVLKNDGIIFMAIPDKRFTFDIKRNNTPIEHFVDDYYNGYEKSEQEHFFDFVKYTSYGTDKTDSEIYEIIKDLKNRNLSIHYHVFEHQTMLEFFIMLKNKMNFKFEIEFAMAPLKNYNESIFVLKKIQ